jgi:tRNA modification GTPase
MLQMLNTDTIAAIATPLGESGISVIRVSGTDAISLCDRIYKGKGTLVDASTHTVNYGHIIDPETGERIEEVLISIMRTPRSFTREDVVEVSCHGGIVAVKKVLDLLLDQGIRLAEPGEFSKRAFLNGRIDLSQAEAVIDIIRAKSDRAFKVAMKQAEGLLSKRIKQLQQRLIEVMAHIEVNIDYPEHDVAELTSKFIQDHCLAAVQEIEELLRMADQGKVLREGITTAIVGKPNVGKSSLLNMLVQDNKAIVTDIPGTTRDVIEEYIQLNGIPLRLLDTAGLRETSDIVEQIGVERSRSAMTEADLLLLVLNNSEPLTDEEITLMKQVKDRQSICIINKTDLPSAVQLDVVKQYFPNERVVLMSIADNKGIMDLEQAIGRLFYSGSIETGDMTYVSNARHIQLLKKATASLREAIAAAEAYVPIDMIQIDVRNAWEHLGEIIGNAAPDTLIDQIFSQFCLGK